MQLTWAICDALGNVRDTLTERSSASVDLTLNDQRQASVTTSIEVESVKHILPGRSRLKVYCHPEDSNPAAFLLMNGLILQPKVDGTTVTIPAVDPAKRLETASSAALPVFGTAVIDPFWKIELLEQSEWMQLIIDRSDARARAINDLDPSAPPVPKIGIIQGTLADSGIDQTRRPGELVTTWDELTTRAKMNRAPDFEFEPLDRTDGVYAAFNTFWPRQGTDKRDTLILEYAGGTGNVAEFSWEPSGASICNRLVLAGLGKGKRTPVWVAENHHSMRKYGIYCKIKSTPDTRELATLQLRGEEYISRRAHLVNFIDVTPTVEAGGEAKGFKRDAEGNLDPIQGSSFAIPPTFGPGDDFDYWIGDTITVRAKQMFKVPLDRLPGQPESDAYVRVTGAHLEEADEEGNVQVSLTGVPDIYHADVTGYPSEIVVDSQFSGFGDVAVG